MTRRSGRFLHIGLLTILLAMWAVILLGQRNPAKRNFRWIPQMEDSLAFESQRGLLPVQHPEFPPSVEGTVARGYGALPYQATPEDAVRAGRELRSPIAADEKVLRRGAAVFVTFCVVCHGAAGLGDGPVVKRGYPAPPSLLADRARQMPAGQMFHVLTFGQNNMPSYAGQVERDDRWKVIAYVRSLQAASVQAPASVKGSNP